MGGVREQKAEKVLNNLSDGIALSDQDGRILFANRSFSTLLGIAIGLGLGLSLLMAAICGLALPTLLQRLRLRGSLLSAPLLDPIIAAISLTIFLVVALWLIDMLHV